jgi:hypothetical protein
MDLPWCRARGALQALYRRPGALSVGQARGGAELPGHGTAIQVERGREASRADKETRPSSFCAFVEDRLAMLDARLAKINASPEEDSP